MGLWIINKGTSENHIDNLGGAVAWKGGLTPVIGIEKTQHRCPDLPIKFDSYQWPKLGLQSSIRAFGLFEMASQKMRWVRDLVVNMFLGF